MTRVGVVLSDVYNLNYADIGRLMEGCLRNHIEDFKQDGNGQFDIILKDKIQSSYHLDDILGTLYNSFRDYLIGEELDLLPINIFMGNFNRGLIKWDYLYVFDENDVQWDDRINYKVKRLIQNVEAWREMRSREILETIGNFPHDHNKYTVTALGGTFDHLHDGHKILLTLAAFLTSDRLIIGLTEEELLKNKKFKDVLQDFDTRYENVVSFLNTFKPTLKIEIVPLKDVCGPTGTVPEIECLVVSRETVKGGEQVNQTRKERGMSQLEVYTVNVLGGKEEDGWKEKMSSTDIRRLISDRNKHSPK